MVACVRKTGVRLERGSREGLQRRKGKLENGGYVYYLDWGVSFTGVYIYQNSADCAFLEVHEVYFRSIK